MKVQSIVAPLSVCSLEARQGLQVVEVSRQARHGEVQEAFRAVLQEPLVRGAFRVRVQEPLVQRVAQGLQELLQVRRDA